MSLIPLGILATSGAGPQIGYQLLTTALVTSDVNSVDFTNLSIYNSYQHLQLRISHKYSDQIGVAFATYRIFFNNDTAANYNGHYFTANANFNNPTITASSYTTFNHIFPGQSMGNNQAQFSTSIIDILDPFETTKNKTIRSLSGGVNANISNVQRESNVGLWSGAWRNTAAISSIHFQFDAGQKWMNGTRVSLYGLRGA